MPRRGNELVQLPLPPKKKTKTVEEPSSLDVSFCDDEALPPGIVFTDVLQKKWRIGKPIGRGSFGRIYLASDDVDTEVSKQNARYVVKIEPHTNGPLFVEIHCLIRTAQSSQVKAWRLQNKQKRIGMPVYIASGSFTDENTGTKYRFLVLPRYDIDLQKIVARTRVLDIRNVLVLALQILDVLEYLHNQGYTHSDIKSSNLMLGFDGSRIGKATALKTTPSFQKDTKEVAVLSGKHRRAKPSKSRSSNYYDDEDFVIKEHRNSSNLDQVNDNDKRLANVKKKLRKILSDRDSRTLHRHHAFNLRQISNYVNYEDMNSSVCSDQSYQKLLDDFGGKNLIRTTKEFQEDTRKRNAREKRESQPENVDEIYQEAVLSQNNGQIYLLDYGLASKFLDSEGKHKDFGMDARKAHDGTLEYSSRDSHIGAHSRRSDLETLGYNLLDWLTGTLPWKTTEVLAEPDLVHALKKNFMSDIKLLLKTCFKTEFYPQFMEKYLEYVTSLDFKENPDYDYCRSLFKSELLKNGCNSDKDMTLNFMEAPMSPMSRKLCYSKRFGKKNTTPSFLARNGIKKAYERENVCSLENDLKLELLKQTLNTSSDGVRKPCASRNFFISDADLVARLKKSLMPHDIFGKKLSPKNLRSKKKNIKKRRGVRTHRNSIGKFGNFMGSARQFTWAEILAGNPEDIIRKERNTVAVNTEYVDDETCKYRIRKLSNASENSDSHLQSPLMQKDYLQNLNPTYAMKEVVASFKRKVAGKPKEPEETIEGLEGYTPAMIKVYRIKEKREAKEKLEALKQQSTAKKESVQIQPRCTRSMRSKKLPEPSSRVTRQKGSVDSNKSVEVEEVVPKCTGRTKSKSNKRVASKKEDKESSKKDDKEVIVTEPVKPAPKETKKTSPRNKSIAVVTNRRRLRSSKRKK
uniref:non-specific serine/threonine protein kinase n=1 Tax=Heliothis virescens TaxID=7102 RepID=A0A2A4J005_HELVI